MTLIQYKVHQTIYELIFFILIDLLPVFLLTGIHLLPDCFVYLVSLFGQVSGDQYPHRYLHGDGVCVWGRIV